MGIGRKQYLLRRRSLFISFSRISFANNWEKKETARSLETTPRTKETRQSNHMHTAHVWKVVYCFVFLKRLMILICFEINEKVQQYNKL